MCKCAVCLTQLGRVRFALWRYISCAAAVTEPNAFGPARVGGYIYAPLGLRGVRHCFYRGLSVARDSPLLHIPFISDFTNPPFLLLSFLGKHFPSFSAGPTAKNTPPIKKVKPSVSAPFLRDYLHSYLEGI